MLSLRNSKAYSKYNNKPIIRINPCQNISSRKTLQYITGESIRASNLASNEGTKLERE